MAMKAKQLRDETVEELGKREQDLADQLFALRVQKVTGQLDNPAKVSQVKRDLARVLMVLGEKHRAAVAE